MAALPLHGIRVVDFTHMVAGPHATLWLASLGAEVIKIEGPTRPDAFRRSTMGRGDGSLNQSAIFVVTNLMKQSCAIDIATGEGQELIKELVRRSDVVTANYRPGVLESFGLGYETLRQVRPDLIMATLTGYGYTGALARYQALAPNIHAYSGLSAATGYSGGPPESVYSTFADTHAGQGAVLEILAALRHRARTGEGQFVDVAMSEVLIALAPQALIEYAVTGREVQPRGNRDDAMAPHGCYPCRGLERWIAVAVRTEAQWHAFAVALGHPEWLDDARFADLYQRRRHEDALDALIWEAARAWDARELADQLQAAGVPATPSNTAKDLLEDRQLAARGFFQEVEQPELGPAQLPQLPWQSSSAARPELRPAPRFAESTDEVLRDLLELSDEQIVSLRERGVVL